MGTLAVLCCDENTVVSQTPHLQGAPPWTGKGSSMDPWNGQGPLKSARG